MLLLVVIEWQSVMKTSEIKMKEILIKKLMMVDNISPTKIQNDIIINCWLMVSVIAMKNNWVCIQQVCWTEYFF